MKKLILIGLVILLLGGAAGAYFLLAPGGDAKAAEPEARLPKASEFVEIDPIALPVIRAGRVAALVSFRIVVELAPDRSIGDIRAALPRLQDATITQLSALLALNWPAGALLDLEIAKARILERYRQIAGPDIITGVLFRDMMERSA